MHWVTHIAQWTELLHPFASAREVAGDEMRRDRPVPQQLGRDPGTPGALRSLERW